MKIIILYNATEREKKLGTDDQKPKKYVVYSCNINLFLQLSKVFASLILIG